MKQNSPKSLLAGGLLLLALGACTKAITNTYTGNGTAPVFTSSQSSIAPTPADSLTTAVVFSWTDAKYPGKFPSPTLYTIEIDSAGKNFASPAMLTASGVLNDSIEAKVLNSIVLGMGGAFGVPYEIEARVVSSYSNNNAQLFSNVEKIQFTPYKTPPKVTPPPSAELFIVGSATQGGWSNPVPVPTQQFTMIDSTTYKGTFYLSAGGSYDFLPVNGSWSNKYNIATYSAPVLNIGIPFQYVSGGGSDIPAPDSSGVYTITVNFQTGYFTVSPVQTFANLWVPGGYQSWTPASAPMLASVNKDGKYDGYVNLTANSGFKFTGEADWNGTIYGDANAAGNTGVLTTAGGGNNMVVPAVGYYWIQADTKALTWSATAITMWGLIGDFNGWTTDVPMTYNSGSNTWTGSITPASAGGFKVRANGGWTLNYGTGGPGGSMVINGGNIPITAGAHTITMSLAAAGYYTIVVQ